MKIKILFGFLLVVVFFIKIGSDVRAGVIPTIRGKVVTETQRPIVGVWVAMTSSGCPQCVSCLQKKAVRYAQTDSNGEFVFPPVYTPNFSQPGGTCESNPDIGRMIDTDLDGVLDSEMIPKTAATCRDTENGQSAHTSLDVGDLPTVFPLLSLSIGLGILMRLLVCHLIMRPLISLYILVR